MTARAEIFAKNHAILKRFIEFGVEAQANGLEQSLNELIKIRASQLNGCAMCLHMHSRAALAAGETEERIVMLDAWRGTTLYSPRERAALAWTEALTQLAASRAPDMVYDEVRAHFTEEEQVKLSLLIGVINTFNKLGVGFRLTPMPLQRKAA